MRNQVLCLLFLTVLGCGCGYDFTAVSVKSGLYEPIRNRGAQVVTVNQCDKEVTSPRGILEHSFKQATADQSPKCTWRIHATANQVVNVIRVSFVLEDELKSDDAEDYARTSTISLYDGKEAEEGKLLTRYFVSLTEKVGYFIQSQSSGQDMTVEVAYHDNKNYNTQKMSVEYEFLDVEKIAELQKKMN